MENIFESVGRRCAEYEQTGLFLPWAQKKFRIKAITDLFARKDVHSIVEEFAQQLPELRSSQIRRRMAKARNHARFVRRTRLGIV